MLEISTNADQLERDLMKRLSGIEASIGGRVQEIITYIDTRVHQRTPVYTGQAVRNMIWSAGTPSSNVFEAIPSPEETGHTSTMGLGEEPRRAANEAAAKDTLRGLNFSNPFQAFYLTNNSPDIGLIEGGGSGLPGKPRAPEGVFVITMVEVMQKLQSGAPLK